MPTAIICLSPYSGGMEIDSIKLAKKLSNTMQITLIAKSGCFIASKKEELLQYNINLETISFKSSLGLSIIINARNIIKKYGIKNVIFFGASELKSLYFSFLGLDINLIVRHGTTKSKPKKDWFHKLIYSTVNYHVSICKHLEKNVNYIIPFGENTKSKLIYSSFDFQEPVHNKQDRVTLLHTGRIANGKGQIDAIKACEILVKNNIEFQLLLVGGYDENFKNDFLTFYENCTYKENIKLVGFSNDVRSYIQISEIFLFPSYGEGLSNAFLEAIANNLVCISYSNTSFPELKELGLEFIMAKDKDINDLQEKLLEVVQNIDKENAKQNYTLTKNLFSLQKEIDNYMEILR
jgi:glycosyltransferase involved in cell wall biosynthesis